MSEDEQVKKELTKRRRFFSRRSLLRLLAVVVVSLAVFFIVLAILYKTGATDGYIRGEFAAKMDRMGIGFDAGSFHVSASPLELELKDAVFTNKSTGEKLFAIRDGRIALTVKNLYDISLNRDINVDSTDLKGAEIWIDFDENGRSNFSGVRVVEEQNRLNFIYTSTRLSLKDSVAHFGDKSRTISGDAKNLSISLEPENAVASDVEMRYKFDVSSSESNFTYDSHKLEPVDIRAQGIVSAKGADITGLRIKTPVGESVLKGQVTDWATLKYDLEIESTVDLTQTSATFEFPTPVKGIGNFKGRVTGEGENYKVEGEVFSESLAASNIYLKGLSVNAIVSGKDSVYEANGKAIAQMLTFEDFKIDAPMLSGMIRGTGTDFRWLGELNAAAAKTPIGTLGALFISDAVAEYKEEQLKANLGKIRFDSFKFEDVDIRDVRSGNVTVVSKNGVTDVSVPQATAARVKTNDIDLDRVTAKNVRVKDRPQDVVIDAENARAESGATKDSKLKNITAGSIKVKHRNGVTDVIAKNASAERVEANGARISDVVAGDLTVRETRDLMTVYSDKLRVAKIETDAAVLGSLNIAGVRLSIREGVIEGTTGDIDAGDVKLAKSKELPDGGTLQNVKIVKPVFVLEPSGRYRATADMSLGGGVVGSVNLGAARASVNASSDQFELTNLKADVMNGRLDGSAIIAYDSRRRSSVRGNFTELDLSKLLALQGGRIVPLEGSTTGAVDLSFDGTDFKTADGRINADITANAGTSNEGFVPVSGRVETTATRGVFRLDVARLQTEKTEFSANGDLDINGSSSNLHLALASTDAKEIERIFRVLDLAPDFEKTIDEYKAEAAGNLTFDGTLTGSISEPNINGRAMLDSISLRGRVLGSLSTTLAVNAVETRLTDGLLRESDGGKLEFSAEIPTAGKNNIAVRAKLDKVDTGNILAAFPIDLPETFRGLQADTSGDLDLRGLPDEMLGEANLSAEGGSLGGQTFDKLNTRLTFAGTLVKLERFNAAFGDGSLNAAGTYRTDSTAFDFTVDGKSIEFARVSPFIPGNKSLPEIVGIVSLNGRTTGNANDSTTYDVNFNGSGTNVAINGNALGEVAFSGRTENRVLNANLTAKFEGQEQVIAAVLNFADPNLPLRAETNFNNSELAPFISLVRQPSPNLTLTGRATGTVVVEGNVSKVLNGERTFTADDLKGVANFSQFDLQINQTPLNSIEPIAIRFNSREVVVNNAKFAGGGSNVVVSGTKALRDDGINNFSVDGRVNLSILNIASKNAFFAGLSDVSIRLTGPNLTARLNGTADLQSASAAVFVGSERITFERIKGRAIFTSNQVQVNELNGFLGGGKFTASGGAFLGDKLNLEAFRLALRGFDVTLPLPKNFSTTGDAEIEVNGRRIGDQLSSIISGRINAKRSLYSRDIDLADVIGGRREGSISQTDGSSSLGDVRLDLIIEGRDALVVRNNLADLTASLALRVTGDLDYPQVAGRITAGAGMLFYRNDRYEIRRSELVFPPNTDGIDPIINLQAETEINGYQIFLNLDGKLTDAENLTATVRSNPALPQPDVISLITTGSLSNTETGIPTLAQTGIKTAAEILTDEIINKPVTRATDKLFGLNKFQLDPILSGQRLNPTARLTVGRQINRNLLVTYSTNLSEDQNQVLALEYRVSNRLSFVAQYEQRSLSNVTRNKDSFSFEIRFRKRF
ncbi:MAG: translocation/assembly module TamB domain-containing protein [Acidobacteria bacterium]|nr:translocation/assembly module TamB domain-containing protein [Acidobacteriota bacterium]